MSEISNIVLVNTTSVFAGWTPIKHFICSAIINTKNVCMDFQYFIEFDMLPLTLHEAFVIKSRRWYNDITKHRSMFVLVVQGALRVQTIKHGWVLFT